MAFPHLKLSFTRAASCAFAVPASVIAAARVHKNRFMVFDLMVCITKLKKKIICYSQNLKKRVRKW